MASFIERKREIRLAIRQNPPIVKKKFTEPRALDALEKLLGNNLIRVDVGSIKRNGQAGMNSKGVHLVSGFRFRVSGFITSLESVPGAVATGSVDYESLDFTRSLSLPYLTSLVLPLPYINEVARDGGGRGHRRTDEMGAATASLPAFEIPIAG